MRRRLSRHGGAAEGLPEESADGAGGTGEHAADDDPATTPAPGKQAESDRPMPGPVRVWAPNATDGVRLAWGSEPGIEAREVQMTRGARGWWHSEVVLRAGERYGFRIDGGPVRPDPRSPRQPDGPHGWSQWYPPDSFSWSDTAWTGLELAGASLYELHVGTFTAEGTFDAAVTRLAHLVDLGVDVVSLMPVATFPGRHGWGYDGVSLFAVHEPYGGPAGLQRFVDACHARGLAVVLDVVYNHLGPDGNYLADFGPYFTTRYATPWGLALNLDGPGSDEVRAFLLDNAEHWLRGFHLDGLRLDAVHELHDERAVHILEDLAERVEQIAQATGRSRWVIAESDRNDPRTVLPRQRGGLGMDAQWADDVHHALHVALTGETQGYYADFADPQALARCLREPYFHVGGWSSFRERSHGRPMPDEGLPGWRFVASLQTHDQVGNRRAGDRLSALIGPRRLCCGAALLLTAPFTPMLFMGEEWGASTAWQYFTDHQDAQLAAAVRDGRQAEFATHGWTPASVPDPQDPDTVERSRLHWQELEQEPHSTVLRWYRALLALRAARADLRDPDLAAVQVRHDPDAGTVLVHRGDHRVAVNLGQEPARVPLELPEERCVVLLAMDPTVTIDQDGSVTLGPDSAVVVGPTLPRRD